MEIIAHRGASAYALENSRQALELAWRMGADRVELDVRTTADGVPVVLHDADLSRTTNGRGPIAELSWREVAKYRLLNGEPILTLREALALLRGKCSLYLDLKAAEAVEPTLRALQAFPTENTILGCSRPEVLSVVSRLCPGLRTSLLVEGTGEAVLNLAKAAGASFVHLCWERYPDPTRLLTPKFLSRARLLGLHVILWHEERPDEIAKIARLEEVFGFCTDTPDVAVEILRRLRRGQVGL